MKAATATAGSRIIKYLPFGVQLNIVQIVRYVRDGETHNQCPVYYGVECNVVHTLCRGRQYRRREFLCRKCSVSLACCSGWLKSASQFDAGPVASVRGRGLETEISFCIRIQGSNSISCNLEQSSCWLIITVRSMVVFELQCAPIGQSQNK